jgi:hypothetical protein
MKGHGGSALPHFSDFHSPRHQFSTGERRRLGRTVFHKFLRKVSRGG